jgi:hypothetical protein
MFSSLNAAGMFFGRGKTIQPMEARDAFNKTSLIFFVFLVFNLKLEDTFALFQLELIKFNDFISLSSQSYQN